MSAVTVVLYQLRFYTSIIKLYAQKEVIITQAGSVGLALKIYQQ